MAHFCATANRRSRAGKWHARQSSRFAGFDNDSIGVAPAVLGVLQRRPTGPALPDPQIVDRDISRTLVLRTFAKATLRSNLANASQENVPRQNILVTMFKVLSFAGCLINK